MEYSNADCNRNGPGTAHGIRLGSLHDGAQVKDRIQESGSFEAAVICCGVMLNFVELRVSRPFLQPFRAIAAGTSLISSLYCHLLYFAYLCLETWSPTVASW